MSDELHACDKCLRPLGKSEVCWRKDISANGLPIMVAMCEDCWTEFVMGSAPQHKAEGSK